MHTQINDCSALVDYLNKFPWVEKEKLRATCVFILPAAHLYLLAGTHNLPES
jgi:hypothetical protein